MQYNIKDGDFNGPLDYGQLGKMSPLLKGEVEKLDLVIAYTVRLCKVLEGLEGSRRGDQMLYENVKINVDLRQGISDQKIVIIKLEQKLKDARKTAKSKNEEIKNLKLRNEHLRP